MTEPIRYRDDYEQARQDLAKYEMRRDYGYKNQQIAEQQHIKARWGGVRELRRLIAAFEALCEGERV